MEGESSTIDCFLPDRRMEQSLHRQRIFVGGGGILENPASTALLLKQSWQRLHQQPPKVELQWHVQYMQQMKPHQWNGPQLQQQFEWRGPHEDNEMQQMVHTEQEKWMEPHQQIQQSPWIEWMQRMDLKQQTQQAHQINCMNDNKLKRIGHHIIEFMTMPKTKCTVDWNKCHHDTKESFQTESDFTYLKKSFRDGMRKSGNLNLFLTRIA
jgi:hypothetical protein